MKFQLLFLILKLPSLLPLLSLTLFLVCLLFLSGCVRHFRSAEHPCMLPWQTLVNALHGIQEKEKPEFTLLLLLHLFSWGKSLSLLSLSIFPPFSLWYCI